MRSLYVYSYTLDKNIFKKRKGTFVVQDTCSVWYKQSLLNKRFLECNEAVIRWLFSRCASLKSQQVQQKQRIIFLTRQSASRRSQAVTSY